MTNNKFPMKVSVNAPITATCQICNRNAALYDAPSVFGPWAYFCPSCYRDQASPSAHVLGTKLVNDGK